MDERPAGLSVAGATLQPFGLQAPAQLLYPGEPHDRPHRQRTAELGSDKATLELTEWDSCRPSCKARGSHTSGHRLVLRVPCENMPHCHSCECGSGHDIYLTAEQEAGLKALIP